MVTDEIVLYDLHRLQLIQTGFLGYLVLAVVGIMLEMSYIGDVTHIAHFVALMEQVAEQHVKCDGRASMTEMSVAIDSGSADIHAYTALMQRLEKLLGAGECVIQLHLDYALPPIMNGLGISPLLPPLF